MSLVLFKNSIRNFQNSSPFDRSARFYVAIIGNFKHSPYVNFEAFEAFLRIFWTQHYHPELLSEANFKTNRMGSTKWTYHKELDLPVTTFFSFENLFAV